MTQKIKKITTSEAARILGISKTRVLQLINAGIIVAERVGKQFVLKDKDVKAARGRKHGRPRTRPIKAAPVVERQLSPEEARRAELLKQLESIGKPKPPDSLPSPIMQRVPTVPQANPFDKFRPTIKTGIAGQNGGLGFDDYPLGFDD